MTSPSPPDHPFFSVVIPTFRRPLALQEAIESVLAQTFRNFEVLVIDDGPDEATRAVVESFEDPRVRYLVNTRTKGGSGARNTGIFAARGPWVAFLDDDDLWLPEKLERQHQLIASATQDIALVYTGHISFSSETGRDLSILIPEYEGDLFEILLYQNVIKGLYSVAIRRDVLLELGGLDERFPALQDMELYVRVARKHRVASVKELLVRVRVGSGDRITVNYESKLRGSQLFWEAFREDIAKSPRLTARAATRVAQFAFVQGDWPTFARTVPLMLMSGLYDWRTTAKAVRFMASVVLRRWHHFRRGAA